MKFEDAVRHLKRLGLVVVMPDGKLDRTVKRLRLRNPYRAVPVRVLKKGTLPEDLREMIRESRADTQRSSQRGRKN